MKIPQDQNIAFCVHSSSCMTWTILLHQYIILMRVKSPLLPIEKSRNLFLNLTIIKFYLCAKCNAHHVIFMLTIQGVCTTLIWHVCTRAEYSSVWIERKIFCVISWKCSMDRITKCCVVSQYLAKSRLCHLYEDLLTWNRPCATEYCNSL